MFRDIKWLDSVIIYMRQALSLSLLSPRLQFFVSIFYQINTRTMSTNNRTQPPSPHIFAIPFPGRGHINPMMNLCKLLVSKYSTLTVTFVVTEEWLGLLGSSVPNAPTINFVTIPNVLPSELIRGTVYEVFVRAVITKMEAPVEEVMDMMEPAASVIMADAFLPWAMEIGNRRNVPVVSLFTQSPSVFALFNNFGLLVQHKHFPVDLSGGRGDEIIDYIPGISFRLADITTILTGIPMEILNNVHEIFHWMKKSHALVFTSFYELERQVFNHLKETLPFSVYTVGPLIPHTSFNSTSDDTVDYLKWLNAQLAKSVMYISLGSFLSISKVQMDQIVEGVRESGVRCLWVARADTSIIQETIGEMGLVVPWCDQLDALCHSSVGGYLTHCGWNSTLEGVFAGMRMLTFPIAFDQAPNSKLIVDDWNVGMRIKKAGTETVIGSKEISMIIKEFMDLNREENREMRRKSTELQKTCKEALSEGGSSETNIAAFAKEFLLPN